MSWHPQQAQGDQLSVTSLTVPNNWHSKVPVNCIQRPGDPGCRAEVSNRGQMKSSEGPSLSRSAITLGSCTDFRVLKHGTMLAPELRVSELPRLHYEKNSQLFKNWRNKNTYWVQNIRGKLWWRGPWRLHSNLLVVSLHLLEHHSPCCHRICSITFHVIGTAFSASCLK